MSRTEWSSKKVLVFGAKGILGQELMASLGSRLGDDAPTLLKGVDLCDVDICKVEAVSSLIDDFGPHTVINAAAYTDVDGCETKHDLAFAVNADAVKSLAEACKHIGATLVHFSTDFIFDGHTDKPYVEDATANPLSVYGKSKWQGEVVLREQGGSHLVVRTSWLFGLGGKNFVEAILNQADKGGALRVVNDQHGCPTYAPDLADAVMRLLDVEARGTVHFCNAGVCSWYEFAREIISSAGCKQVEVEPIRAEQWDRPAKLPGYSALDTSRFVQLTGHQPATWRDALARYLLERANRKEHQPQC